MKFKFPILLMLVSVLAATSFVSCKKNQKNKTGTFTDERDGKQYEWVEIGDQVWMSENLAYTGDNGFQVHKTLADDSLNLWSTGPYDGWCYYNDDESNALTYGVLYQWEAAIQAAPEGWHLPTYGEMSELKTLLFNKYSKSGWENQTGICLATDYGWEIDEGTMTVGNTDSPEYRNNTGFSGLPAGYRTYGGFGGLGTNAYWWSSTNSPPEGVYRLSISSREDTPYLVRFSPSDAVSVRCIRD
jgi:uncharacterized protein (TIGR02145 family)